jgi:hypothetical protein
MPTDCSHSSLETMAFSTRDNMAMFTSKVSWIWQLPAKPPVGWGSSGHPEQTGRTCNQPGLYIRIRVAVGVEYLHNAGLTTRFPMYACKLWHLSCQPSALSELDPEVRIRKLRLAFLDLEQDKIGGHCTPGGVCCKSSARAFIMNFASWCCPSLALCSAQCTDMLGWHLDYAYSSYAQSCRYPFRKWQYCATAWSIPFLDLPHSILPLSHIVMQRLYKLCYCARTCCAPSTRGRLCIIPPGSN